MTYKSSVDIVLPVLNEQDVLNISVSRLLKFCSEGMVSYNWKIIIADNGSTDETYNIAKQIESDSKNVNVMSNNLLILNGEKLIVIPLKDIIGQTDENLNSIITAAFDPKETLTEIRDSINKELKSNVSNDNNEKSEKNENNLNTTDGEITNDEIKVSEFKSSVKNNIKNVVKAEKEKAEAEKAADKAAKDLVIAKKELEDLKSKLNKVAYEKALEALEDARKILSEKNDILLAATAKASKEAAEYASAKAKVESKKAIKDDALNNLKLAEASADAKEVAKNTSQQTLDDISGRTAFNNALKAGATLGAAGGAANNAILAAATNAAGKRAGAGLAEGEAGKDARACEKRDKQLH